MFSASPSCLLPLDLMPGLHLDGPKVCLTHAREIRVHLPRAWSKKAALPHTRSEEAACPGHSPRRGGSQGTQRDPPLPPSHAAIPLSSSLFSREETGNLAIHFFSIFFFYFPFSPSASGGAQLGAAVPAGSRCRRGGAGCARRPRGDKAGDGPRGSGPHCVSEEEMDEGHFLPLFRCPAPGKSCAL